MQAQALLTSFSITATDLGRTEAWLVRAWLRLSFRIVGGQSFPRMPLQWPLSAFSASTSSSLRCTPPFSPSATAGGPAFGELQPSVGASPSAAYATPVASAQLMQPSTIPHPL